MAARNEIGMTDLDKLEVARKQLDEQRHYIKILERKLKNHDREPPPPPLSRMTDQTSLLIQGLGSPDTNLIFSTDSDREEREAQSLPVTSQSSSDEQSHQFKSLPATLPTPRTKHRADFHRLNSKMEEVKIRVDQTLTREDLQEEMQKLTQQLQSELRDIKEENNHLRVQVSQYEKEYKAAKLKYKAKATEDKHTIEKLLKENQRLREGRQAAPDDLIKARKGSPSSTSREEPQGQENLTHHRSIAPAMIRKPPASYQRSGCLSNQQEGWTQLQHPVTYHMKKGTGEFSGCDIELLQALDRKGLCRDETSSNPDFVLLCCLKMTTLHDDVKRVWEEHWQGLKDKHVILAVFHPIAEHMVNDFMEEEIRPKEMASKFPIVVNILFFENKLYPAPLEKALQNTWKQIQAWQSARRQHPQIRPVR